MNCRSVEWKVQFEIGFPSLAHENENVHSVHIPNEKDEKSIHVISTKRVIPPEVKCNDKKAKESTITKQKEKQHEKVIVHHSWSGLRRRGMHFTGRTASPRA